MCVLMVRKIKTKRVCCIVYGVSSCSLAAVTANLGALNALHSSRLLR